ncbi:unnamed protein product, partial [Meganyctiphanes norvegica]
MVMLTCDVSSNLAKHVLVKAWNINGRTITPSIQPDGRYWVLPGGQLVVRHIKPSDAYSRVSCTAAHALSPTDTTTSNIGKIIVQGTQVKNRPVILLQQGSVHGKAGETLLLPCLAKGNPQPQLRWYKEDRVGQRRAVGQQAGRLQVLEGQLLLRNIGQQDRGTYTCVASNDHGQAEHSVKVDIVSQLVVSVTPSEQRVDLGYSASMTCHVEGSPVTSVTWLRNGRPLPSLPRMSVYARSLHINQVTREDSGMYQCVASNQEDSAQAAALLILGDSAPVWEYRFISQTLQPGPSVSLKCIATGSPTPRITWALDGYPLTQHQSRVVVGQQQAGVGGTVVSHVNLTTARVEDGGSYSCTAENQAGTTMHSARLNIYGPAYVRPMGVVLAVAGETLYMHCPAAGYPITKITWQREGVMLPTVGRQAILPNGTLTVSGVRKPDDSGPYTCTATGAHGRMHSATANVQVRVPPKLSPIIFHEDLSLGDRVSIQCAVLRGDTPLHISWSKDESQVEILQGVQVRSPDEFTSTLIIVHLTPENAGNYTCTAKNEAASKSQTAELHVNVPPTWTLAPRDVSVTVGANIVIPCQAQGFPPPKVIWKKPTGGQQGQYNTISEFGRAGGAHGAHVAENGSLVLEDVQIDDGGQYNCEASNGVGPPLSASVTININAPPSFDQSLTKSISVRRGATAKLQCHARGDPPIKLHWQAEHTQTHGRSVVRELNDGVRGELTIPSVSASNSGSFTCVATNLHGTDTFTLKLLVQDVPRAPHGLRVSDRGSRILVISWLTYETQIPVQRYIVNYKKTQASWSDGVSITVSGKDNSLQLEPLEPNTSYIVRIKAANNLGESPTSEPLQVVTLGEAPSGAPSGVVAEAISSTSIRVTWKDPPTHLHNAQLQGYNIAIKKLG